MFDPDKIIAALQRELPKGLEAIKTEGGALIDKVKSDDNSKNTAMGAAAAGALGAVLLSGVMGKFGRKMATYGGLAALGTLAYQAWQKHKGDGDEGKFLPTDSAARATIGKATLKAIINAMKADGKIDDSERARLYNKLQKAALSDEEKAFLLDELEKPIDTEALVAAATTQEIALELYAASLVAINPDGVAEKAYLADLAKKLNLAPELIAHVHAGALEE
ncbi:tellurite resistance TerB family protein [Pseudaquidulcibacter saccharophilus]|uniref:tellurite resistance TerB family protein n=1 Tax=Pseudaquidulcibacter saccharophilus TaxID=2831900 RepID=UPI001EFF2DC6|nr:tellurite resistance TerB family protein [Pseudaquidulcibacter saccharophilus]